MAVLTDVNYTKYVKLEALREAARTHNIEFSIHRVAKGEEIAAAIDSARASGATALNLVSSPLFYAYRHLIMDRVVAARLPTIYEFPETAEWLCRLRAPVRLARGNGPTSNSSGAPRLPTSRSSNRQSLN